MTAFGLAFGFEGREALRTRLILIVGGVLRHCRVGFGKLKIETSPEQFSAPNSPATVTPRSAWSLFGMGAATNLFAGGRFAAARRADWERDIGPDGVGSR